VCGIVVLCLMPLIGRNVLPASRRQNQVSNCRRDAGSTFDGRVGGSTREILPSGNLSPSEGETVGAKRQACSKLRMTITLFLTGLLGIGFEAIGVRVLAQVLENTVYTFASALSVYLLGTALGAALYQRFGRGRNFRILLTDLLCGLALCCA